MAWKQQIGRLWFSVYYPYCRWLTRMLPWITVDGKRLRVLPSVHKPMDNVQKLVELIPEGARVLDLGCGCGVLAVFAAAKSREVTAVDINPEAVANTELNCRRYAISNVLAVRADMFEGLTGEFDAILANPPFFSLDFSDPKHQWATSTSYLGKLFGSAPKFLSPDGALTMLFPASERERLRELARSSGLEERFARDVPNRPLRLALMSAVYLQLIPPLKMYGYARRNSGQGRPEPARSS